MTPDERCPFCEIAETDPLGQIEELFQHFYHPCFVIEPLNPVVPGHRLVIPVRHVANAAVNQAVAADVMRGAATVAFRMGDCNIITSVGEAATQTVMHLHVHVVPRNPGDGLKLPWSP